MDKAAAAHCTTKEVVLPGPAVPAVAQGARPRPRRVLIVQRRMTHYRLPLFDRMRELLDTRGIRLDVAFGDPTAAEARRQDSGKLPWGIHVACRYLLGGRLCWQNAAAAMRGADLVVLTQENKLLYNHLLMLAPRRYRLAFWGHGANLQSGNPDGLKERFKRWTANRVDWWFAYTQMSANLVAAAGFPERRTTVLNNAVDTSELSRQRRSLTVGELTALRTFLGLGVGPVGVYVGSFHADKRLDFLFAAAGAIRAAVPDFQLLVVGDGPERDKVQAWCAAHPWGRWAGPQFGREKVAHVALASVMLNPGLVGLGILDAFVCGVPMVTTDCGLHSPEIAYLENGINGLMTADDCDAYAQACIGLLRDNGALAALRAGCAASAGDYTVENMALRFADGIQRALVQ